MLQKRILFVFANEDQSVLDGIVGILNRRQQEWDILTASSGAEAMSCFELGTIDVIVTDVALPGTSGLDLLRQVEVKSPGTVRFVLSTTTDYRLAINALGVAHRSISKPCDPEQLRQFLTTSLGLRELLANKELHSKIAATGTLPSPPELYTSLMTELQSDDLSMKRVGDLIARDIAMSAKILQMVNSAFFGLSRRVENVSMAVNLLGADVIKALVLTAGAFSQFEVNRLPGISLESIYSHSVIVGGMARKVAETIGLHRQQCDDAMMAGMLHDIGKLVMLCHFREELATSLSKAKEKSIPLVDAEKQTLRVTHADIGAHLLSLWGLPDAILEAVAMHHDPLRMPCPAKTALTAVHIANALAHETANPNLAENNPGLNQEYLKQTFVLNDLPRLRELCSGLETAAVS